MAKNRALQQQALVLLRQIPKGKVTTYKAIAEALGTKAYRAVGSAMRCNREPDKYPCFKVVKSDGSVGEYSAAGGVAGKIKRLKKEGIAVKKGKVVDFSSMVYRFR